MTKDGRAKRKKKKQKGKEAKTSTEAKQNNKYTNLLPRTPRTGYSTSTEASTNHRNTIGKLRAAAEAAMSLHCCSDQLLQLISVRANCCTCACASDHVRRAYSACAPCEILRCSAASVSDFDGLMCVPRAQAILRKGGFLKVGAEDLLSLPVCELQELVSLAQRYQSEVRALGTRRRLGALCQFWLDRRLPSALVEAVSSFLPARVDLDFRASAPVSGLLSVRCVGSWRASEHGLMPCKSACFLSFSFSLSSSLSFSFSHV